MKRFICLFVLTFCAFVIIFHLCRIPDSGDRQNERTDEPADEPYAPKFTKAVWLSQYDLAPVYLSGGAQRKKQEFCELAERILDNCVALGFDTVIVQVRPNGDSMYPSAYFPESAYVTGEYGRALLYDPFEIMVSLCRARRLSVHAWINPLRLMRTDEIGSISESSAVRRWWKNEETKGKYVVEHEGRLYLNPAYAEVRALIANGAAEIVEHYAVDGVHMDDYFYPHGIGAEFDSDAYKMHGGALSLENFRRENISKLVLKISSSIKSENSKMLFGISPGGNLETVFNTDYADVYKWCSVAGYIDYICPQIYFGLEHETHAFDRVYRQWEALKRDPSVSLFVGITLHKAENASLGIGDAYAGTGKNEWISSQCVLADCLEFLQGEGGASGIAFFSYRHFFDPVTGEENKNTEDERKNFMPVWKEF